MKKLFKHMVVWFMILLLTVSSCVVYAEKEDEKSEAKQEETEKSEKAKTENNEKKKETSGIDISSEAAILTDFASGRVLFEKNADEKVYPASTTKIMTAILAIENLDFQTVLTATETAINIDRDGSNMGILKDEQFTVEQLLYGLLVHSANDAANMLAEGVAGTIDNFVVLMNDKAKELGMKNTHFVNPHGYHHEDHYMSARDLSILASYAMRNDKFAAIAQTPNYELPPTDKYPEVRYLSSNNMLLNPMKGRKYLYEGAKGIKTGHTEAAGYCLASMAQRDNETYVCVTMKSPLDENDNHSFTDTIALLDYAFESYDMKTISNVNDILATAPVKWAKGGKQAVLTTNAALELLLPANFNQNELATNISISENVKAPVKEGDVLGSIEYIFEDRSLGVIDLVATEDIKRSFIRTIFGSIFDFIFSAWVMVPFFTIVILLFLVRSYNMRKRRKKREMMRRQNRNNF